MKENHDDDGDNQHYIAMESTYLTSSFGQNILVLFVYSHNKNKQLEHNVKCLKCSDWTIFGV